MLCSPATEKTTTYTNDRPCPVCGSDMRREADDNPNDVYIEHRVCCNPDCGVSKTFYN